MQTYCFFGPTDADRAADNVDCDNAVTGRVTSSVLRSPTRNPYLVGTLETLSPRSKSRHGQHQHPFPSPIASRNHQYRPPMPILLRTGSSTADCPVKETTHSNVASSRETMKVEPRHHPHFEPSRLLESHWHGRQRKLTDSGTAT